jgi:hypothetical protein
MNKTDNYGPLKETRSRFRTQIVKLFILLPVIEDSLNPINCSYYKVTAVTAEGEDKLPFLPTRL